MKYIGASLLKAHCTSFQKDACLRGGNLGGTPAIGSSIEEPATTGCVAGYEIVAAEASFQRDNPPQPCFEQTRIRFFQTHTYSTSTIKVDTAWTLMAVTPSTRFDCSGAVSSASLAHLRRLEPEPCASGTRHFSKAGGDGGGLPRSSYQGVALSNTPDFVERSPASFKMPSRSPPKSRSLLIRAGRRFRTLLIRLGLRRIEHFGEYRQVYS